MLTAASLSQSLQRPKKYPKTLQHATLHSLGSRKQKVQMKLKLQNPSCQLWFFDLNLIYSPSVFWCIVWILGIISWQWHLLISFFDVSDGFGVTKACWKWHCKNVSPNWNWQRGHAFECWNSQTRLFAWPSELLNEKIKCIQIASEKGHGDMVVTCMSIFGDRKSVV